MKTTELLIATALVCSSVEAFVAQQATARSNTRLAYESSSAAMPELPSQHKAEVQGRIRKLSKRRISSKHVVDGAVEVLRMRDFQKEVLDEKEKLVVVRFYAPWCVACKAVVPSYSKFVKGATTTHADRIKFVDCPFTVYCGEIHETLGVNAIPSVRMYHPETGLVEERLLWKKHYDDFERTAKSYLDGECELKDGDACVDPSPNVLRSS